MKNKRDLPTRIAAFGTAAILLLLSVSNAGLWAGELGRLIRGELSFREMTRAVQTDLHSDGLRNKNDFITVKGLFDRLTGRRQTNEVVRLNNGMLTGLTPKVDALQLASGFSEFSDLLKDCGIPFLFVQAPLKIDSEGTLLPAGIEDHSRENSAELVRALEEAGVDTLDLWPVISGSAEAVERNFYRTDHHWNADGAFLAFRTILERINESYFDLDLSLAREDRWERNVIGDMLLGSSGRRVGPLYGGTDDLIYLRPEFGTRMSFAVPEKNIYRSGDFEQTLVWQENLSHRDYFGRDNYSFYLGGGYPLELHRNAHAPNDRRILLIKDSFAQPVIAYLCTIFREVDVIDPRLYEGSVAEYALQTGPDLVITMICPGSATTVYSDTGAALERTRLAMDPESREILREETVVIAPGTSDYHAAVLYDALEPGVRYTLTGESLSFDAGFSEFITIGLYSEEASAFLWQTAVDTSYENGAFSVSFTVPGDASGSLQLLAYAGIRGRTAGIGVTLHGLTLSQTLYSGGTRVPVYGESGIDFRTEGLRYAHYRPGCSLMPGTAYAVDVSGVRVEGAEYWTAALLNGNEVLWTGRMHAGRSTRSFTVETPAEAGDYKIALYPGGDRITIESLCISRLCPENARVLMTARDVSLAAGEDRMWFCDSLPVSLKAGCSYAVSFENITVTSGSPEATQIRLFGAESRQTLGSADLAPAGPGKWTFTVPEGEDAGLLVYTGLPGSTQGVSLTYHGLQVQEVPAPADCGMVLTVPELSGSCMTPVSELIPGKVYYVTIAHSDRPVRVQLVSGEEILEEHFWDPEQEAAFGGLFTISPDAVSWNACALRIVSEGEARLENLSISYLSPY